MDAKPIPTTFGRIRRLLPHLRTARWDILGGSLAGVIYGITSGAGLPIMLQTIVPIIFGETKGLPAPVIKGVHRVFADPYAEKIISLATENALLVACIGLPLIFFIRGLAGYANRYLITRGGFRILEGLRMEVFDRLQQLPLSFYQRYKSGDLQSRLMGDTNGLKDTITKVSSEIIKQPIVLCSALSFLLFKAYTERSALFALVALISVPLCVFPIRIVAKRIKKRSRQLAEYNGEITSTTTETLQSPAEIQAYNLQSQQRNRFSALTEKAFTLSIKAVKYDSIPSPLIEFISMVGFAIALYVSAGNGMTYGTFSALAFALYACYEPIKKLSDLNASLKNGEVCLERLEAVLHATDTVPDPVSPVALPSAAPSLRFDRVGFSYDTADQSTQRQAALRDITLTIRPGETVALVGPSGAGKSTFAAMIPRFYDPTAGTITFNNVDLRAVTKKELRDRIALVSQTPVLFNATLADNIRAGRLGASDAEVQAAAEKAHLGAFIATLPQGLQTPMGERGSSLSGGQRQRVAIARAFLKDAPILILDEATSALDSESEASIQAALQELAKGRTTLMIAHRFSSIRHATRILVFEDGRIVADGPHDELYATSPLYRSLYDQQAPARSA
jgi:subfamily B ATP-binding cassette protein MsbA